MSLAEAFVHSGIVNRLFISLYIGFLLFSCEYRSGATRERVVSVSQEERKTPSHIMNDEKALTKIDYKI